MIKEIRKNQPVNITNTGVATEENKPLENKYFEPKKHFNYVGCYYENNIHNWNQRGINEQSLPPRRTIVKTPYS
jgi:hypothetical protein